MMIVRPTYRSPITRVVVTLRIRYLRYRLVNAIADVAELRSNVVDAFKCGALRQLQTQIWAHDDYIEQVRSQIQRLENT